MAIVTWVFVAPLNFFLSGACTESYDMLMLTEVMNRGHEHCDGGNGHWAKELWIGLSHCWRRARMNGLHIMGIRLL